MPTPVIIAPKSSCRLLHPVQKQKLLTFYKTNKSFHLVVDKIISNNNAKEIALAYLSERKKSIGSTKEIGQLKKDVDTISKNASHVQKTQALVITDKEDEIKRLKAHIANLEYADKKQEGENEALKEENETLKGKLREIERIAS